MTSDMSFATYNLAHDIASLWASGEPGFRARKRTLNTLADYFASEYDRRVRRHAFYADLGYGGRGVVAHQIRRRPIWEAAVVTGSVTFSARV